MPSNALVHFRPFVSEQASTGAAARPVAAMRPGDL